MSKRLVATQAQIRTAIAAATKAGLTIYGIRPDGTVVVENDMKGVSIVPDSGENDPYAAGAARVRHEKASRNGHGHP